MSIDLDSLARTAVAAAPSRVPELGNLRRRMNRRRRNRRILTGVAVAPLVALAVIAAWVAIGREDPPTQIIATDATANPPDLAGRVRVARTPTRRRKPDELVNRFIAEVLDWPQDRVRQRESSDDYGPQVVTVLNPGANRELRLLATPSPQGWGFVQVGGASISVGEAVGGGSPSASNPPPARQPASSRSATSTVRSPPRPPHPPACSLWCDWHLGDSELNLEESPEQSHRLGDRSDDLGVLAVDSDVVDSHRPVRMRTKRPRGSYENHINRRPGDRARRNHQIVHRGRQSEHIVRAGLDD